MSLYYPIVASLLIASCDAMTSAQTNEDAPAVEIEQVSQRPDHASIEGDGALQAYEGNDLYVVVDVDINMDGTLDKVVSSAQNKGSELIFFKSTDGGYRAVLVSTNLTEDGGRILGEIKQEAGGVGENDVVSIETFFPKGIDVATHYISYSENEWELSRTIYVVSDWRNRENVIHRCEVEQNIPMQELILEEAAPRVRQLPDESTRDHVCTLESLPET